ncbi:PadR family transcriptional regulator [Cellulosimicrobium composti]|uniref:Helix-turn-helix transcriptional regulator n=1 Tax=Cellulosimicrobium composti TaxID=2672572 RepID=A0A6N7ZL05_9MICO|nr:PadR family transcriptional regulator [Cellulosimicrobium composti]MTG89963.1 PadR family transcriptional regulator [Cellulosimicrobium composti]NDO89763.1 helix-turn-helix transcriptional regulator [Cellulosimicrobium composti]TWG87745.1 DNA-binding PadR family transcriptional regulator [Cellulosimicrobium cellulans J34]SME96659.1 transcriptional regulator, PadR family [Cellulosimicrobium cellulans J1]
MATVFAHGQLRLYLLALLDAGPKHGYELITELSDRFGGTYRPSAGTIYPRLARLEDEGLVHRSADGRKTTYELTPAGRAEIEARRADVAALEHGIAETVRQRAEALRADVQGSLQGLRAELAAAAQSARARPRSGEPERRRASSVARAEAEAVLQRFREEVRADLRRADAAGVVSDLTVDTLRTVLESARRAVRATLP